MILIANSEDNMKHLFIIKGEEMYLYEKNTDHSYERLETFKEPDVQEGPWKGTMIWFTALGIKLEKHLPLYSMSSMGMDSQIIRDNMDDLLAGNLTPKQIRDMLGITTEMNEQIAGKKAKSFDDLVKELRQEKGQ